MKSRIIAMAIAGLGLFAAPFAQADSCDSTTKTMVGPGVTEYRYTEMVTPAQSVVIERPVLLENRIIEKQVVKERVPVYINRRVSYRPVKHNRTVHRVANAKCSNKVISRSSTIERTIEKPIVVERPVVVERNRMVERPVFVDRVVEKPVFIERKVVSNPVVIQRTVSRPVVIQRPVTIERTIQQPIIIEKKKRHLLNLHVL